MSQGLTLDRSGDLPIGDADQWFFAWTVQISSRYSESRAVDGAP
jgi:hypothetical protein